MKKSLILVISSIFLMLSSNAFSLDLSKELSKVTGGNSDVSKSLKGIANIDQKIEKAINKVKDETLGKVDVEINKIKEKIEKEEAKVREIIKEAEDGINKFREIKANAEKYIGMAKMIAGLASAGIVGLLFFLFRIWRNIVTFRKLIKNVANYDEIKQQIAALEDQVAKLGGGAKPATAPTEEATEEAAEEPTAK